MLAVAAIVPLALAAPAVAAESIEPGDTVWVGPKVGYPGTGMHSVYSPAPADPANPGPADFYAYCIEHDIPSRSNVPAEAGGASDYLGSNFFTQPAVRAKVAWVLAHSYPALSLVDFGAASGATGISADDAIEATQYAIWRYTDLGFDAAWPFETPDSETAYWYLVNGANADTAVTPPADVPIQVSVTAPAAPGEAGTLYGPFTVSTTETTARVASSPGFTITNAAGTPIDVNAVVDGQQLYLDLRGATAAGSATITATVDGASGTNTVITTPEAGSDIATPESHAQTLILVAASTATTSGSAPGTWAAAAVPTIGTTLVDAADEDHTLAWNGGSLVDTIAYSGLTPGQQYTVSGELMLKSDGSATGITGSTTFTPTEAEGTVEVSFTVPTGYAGESLVAFESLYEGGAATGTPVAVHQDIDDVNQTVAVAAAPTIGTTLVDAADEDHTLAWNGGTVIDTIAYTGLTIGQEYTVSGELMLKSDGSATGITGSTTFTPTAANGTVEVSFTVPTGYAGESLVAFESLYEGGAATGTPVAVHQDINDVNQTVAVAAAPTTTTPGGGLAVTGGSLPVGLTAAAATAVLLGAVILIARRRARSDA